MRTQATKPTAGQIACGKSGGNTAYSCKFTYIPYTEHMSEAPSLTPFRRTWLHGDEELSNPTIASLVAEGKLPADLLARLATIGEWEPDPEYPNDKRSLYLNTLADAVLNANDPQNARPDTQELVWGNTPNTIVDIGWNDSEIYRQLPTLYWGKSQLARAIKQRRAAEGVTIKHAPRNSWYEPWELESRRCSGLAQPLWRVLTGRLNPNILEHPEWFYPRTTISFNVVYELGQRTVQRHAIANTHISNDALVSLYGEIEKTGIKGVGPVGKLDLAAMLAQENEDIMMKLARESGIDIEEIKPTP